MHGLVTQSMKPGQQRALCVIGDDISGTTEALAAALSCTEDAAPAQGLVHLRPTGSAWNAQDAVWHAVDLDARNVPSSEAYNRYSSVFAQLQGNASAITMVKIDSLLRGNVAAAMTPIQPARDRPVILAPALPAQNRSTVAGRIVLPTSVPRPGSLEGIHVDVVAAAGRPAEIVHLHEVRGDQHRLMERLAELAVEGVVGVCDADNDDDLDAIAAATLTFPSPVLVGASGLAAAVGRHMITNSAGVGAHHRSQRRECQSEVRTQSSVLVVAGTAESSIEAQIHELSSRDVDVVEVPAAGPTDAVIATLRNKMNRNSVVLRAPTAPHDPRKSDEILERIAGIANAVVTDRPSAGLVLTGGATARAVLDRLGIVTLRLCCQVHPGAAHLATTTGQNVLIRPGSHGAIDSLLEAVRHLGGLSHASSPQRPPTVADTHRKGS